MKTSTLNACGKIIWPNLIAATNNDSSIENEYANIIDLAHAIGGEGFTDMDIEDIEELLEDTEISTAELVSLVNHEDAVHNVDRSLSSDDSNNVVVNFTAKIIADGLRLGTELAQYFVNRDPDIERSLKFQRSLKSILKQYEEVYKDIRQSKQMLITNFVPAISSETTKDTVSCSNHQEVRNIDEISLCDSESDAESIFEPIQTHKKRRLIISESSDEN